MQRHRGFTLMELMVVMTIIAILLRLAMPAYKQYVQRGYRVNAQSQMTNLAQAMERYKAQNFSYNGATLKSLNNNALYFYQSSASASSSTATYQIAFGGKDAGNASISADPGNFVIIATPANAQVGTGNIAINNLGQRCYNPSSDSSCSFSDPTQAW